jgi:hypothetical protein
MNRSLIWFLVPCVSLVRIKLMLASIVSAFKNSQIAFLTTMDSASACWPVPFVYFFTLVGFLEAFHSISCCSWTISVL